MKVLSVRIPEALLVKLKVEAAKQQTSVQTMVAAALEEHLKRGAKVEGDQRQLDLPRIDSG